MTENIRAGFATLFAAVCFVLLIACSNVANLLLVRFSGRRREIALRMAIGASRGSIVRLFVWESLLVSIFAGALGAFVAWRLVPLVPKMASNFLPLEGNTASSLSLEVLAFTIALSLLTGLLMGIYPALQASRADLVGRLKEGGRGTSGSIRQQRFRKILVGAQVALSVTLLAGAALLITSFIRLSTAESRLPAASSLDRRDQLPTAQYPDAGIASAFYRANCSPRCATRPVSRTRPSVAIFRLNGGNRTLYARADRDVPPVEQPGHCAESRYRAGISSRPGESRLSPGVILTNTTPSDGRNVCLISQTGAKKVFPERKSNRQDAAGDQRSAHPWKS